MPEDVAPSCRADRRLRDCARCAVLEILMVLFPRSAGPSAIPVMPSAVSRSGVLMGSGLGSQARMTASLRPRMMTAVGEARGEQRDHRALADADQRPAGGVSCDVPLMDGAVFDRCEDDRAAAARVAESAPDGAGPAGQQRAGRVVPRILRGLSAARSRRPRPPGTSSSGTSAAAITGWRSSPAPASAWPLASGGVALIRQKPWIY